MLWKEPVGKQFFVFRFLICKTLSITVNGSLVPALETVSVTLVFSALDLKF